MKYFIIAATYCLLGVSAAAQHLIIKGKIKCLNQSPNSSRGAENIVVVPAYQPSIATITSSGPAGYFEMNTGVPLARLQDKQVTVYLISRCNNCAATSKRVFISEDQDRRNRTDNKQYVTIKDWMLQTNCTQAELVPLAADSVLNLVTKQPGQNLDKMAGSTALVGAPPFLNFLSSIVSVVGTTGFPQNDFIASSLGTGNLQYGQFLHASPMFETANQGFNFAPARDMSEAVFWNPASTALSRHSGNISLFTNFRTNAKLGGYHRLTPKFTLGAGGIYTRQQEFRQVTYLQNAFSRIEDSVNMKLEEFAAFLSPAYQINNRFSVGMSVKSVWQQFNAPAIVTVDAQGKGSFTDSDVKKQHFEVDVSALFKASPSFQIGVNLMNLTGSKLNADAYVANQAVAASAGQRAYGIGLVYKWQRLNIGSDLLITDDGLYDASLGANYVPFNNALVSAGLSFKQLGYSFAFRMKHFRVAYVSDNDWLQNERRKPRSKIFDGRIYGGFVFDFN